MSQRQLVACCYASCAALAMGSLGPWVYGPLQGSGFFGGSGVDGDGVFTLLGAGLVAVIVRRWTVFGRRSMLMAAQVVACLCTALILYSLYDIHDYYGALGETGAARVGWGLALALISAAALTMLCIPLYRRARPGKNRPFAFWKIGLPMIVLIVVLASGFVVASSAEPDPWTPEAVVLEGESGPWTVNSEALDRQIMVLEPGTSIDAVASRLGNPASATAFEDEVAVSYGLWRLVFTNRGLDTRTRYYRSGRRAKRANGRTLNGEIMRLQLGMSIKDIKAELGSPETLQIYRNAPHKEESLGYGEWSLTFVNGSLEHRSRL